jgi:hypothetical protein
MKTIIRSLVPALMTLGVAAAQTEITFTNFIRQVQLPNGADMFVRGLQPSGTASSPLEINPNGARFELYSVRSAPLTEYLLNTTYVGATVPTATIVIDTEDPVGRVIPATGDASGYPDYKNTTFLTTKMMPSNSLSVVRRTRADRPFKVYVVTGGYSKATNAPASHKSVDFCRYQQSYGTTIMGEGLDRSQAKLVSPSLPQFSTEGVQSSTTGIPDSVEFPLSKIAIENPNADRRYIKGEETFTVWSLNDTQISGQTIAPNKLASQYLQIWPMSRGKISGITTDQKVRFSLPKVTFHYDDTYPNSHTFAQIYKGELRDNVQGSTVPGSDKTNTSPHSESYLESTGADFDSMFDSDGRWTMEILTVSAFDTIRLDYVTFTVDRSIEVNGSFTTIE